MENDASEEWEAGIKHISRRPREVEGGKWGIASCEREEREEKEKRGD